MLTDEEKIAEASNRSKEIEEETYIKEIAESYDREFERATSLFDEAAEQTDNFRKITGDRIRSDPRIVMILRYLVKPTISQMKFGQLVGVRSTGNYEEFERGKASTPNHETAELIADFVTSHIDPAKVPWLNDDTVNEFEAFQRSKQWIGDKIAEQTAETRYRNWRADKQEKAIEEALEAAGYEESDHTGIVSSVDDLGVGTYVDESKIAGADTQKADLVLRPTAEQLVLIEAKAMGVALDAYKRTKEIRDKASEWQEAFDNASVIAVVEGGLDAEGFRKLSSHVGVYFEHRLGEDFTEDMKELRNKEQ